MKRKIVITGISSAIMQKLFLLIDLSEYEVIGISPIPVSKQLDNLKIVKGDLLNIHEIEYCLEGCYMVIHGAAVTHSRNKKDYYQVNLDATKSLVDIAKDHGVQRFIFVSSNTAGTKSGTYGITKLLAEDYIEQNFDNWTILRLSEVYGGGKNIGIEKLINDVINKPFVFCPGGIPSKFYPIHVDDAVELMNSRIFDDSYLNKITVINGSEGFSFQEVIELTRSIAKSKAKVITLNRKLMFLIKTLVNIFPMNIGIVPDQIDRLYSIKHHEISEGSLMKMGTYIEDLTNTKRHSENIKKLNPDRVT
jgi:nucleoside-diphosphate-sugar epimerase